MAPTSAQSPTSRFNTVERILYVSRRNLSHGPPVFTQPQSRLWHSFRCVPRDAAIIYTTKMNVEKLQRSLSEIRYIHERRSHGRVNLYNIFETVIMSQPLDMNRRKMESILNNDLSISTVHLDRRLVSVLCEALAYYMGVWPGWMRLTTDLPSSSSPDFKRFRQYLTLKCNFILKNAADYEDGKAVHDKGTQTDNLTGKKELAPYDLVIGGPPSVINNLVFTKHAGDIVIKQHPEKPWQGLRLPQFLNWPYVSVTVKMPDISLTRANNHKINRYVALHGDKVVFPEIHYIDYIMKTKPGTEFEPYSYTFFFYYFLQLNIVLQKIPKVNEERRNELAVIFAEYLNDIKEMSVYNSTMSTHSSIGFNIGRCHYIRSKKMVSKTELVDTSAVNFYEVIVPQVDVSLHYFTAVQDQSNMESEEVTFQSLNALLSKLDDSSSSDLDKLAIMINNSSVTYDCALCNRNFTGPSAYESAINHFSDLHKSEQMVLCYKCGVQFDVEVLTEKRWSHNCVPKE